MLITPKEIDTFLNASLYFYLVELGKEKFTLRRSVLISLFICSFDGEIKRHSVAPTSDKDEALISIQIEARALDFRLFDSLCCSSFTMETARENTDATIRQTMPAGHGERFVPVGIFHENYYIFPLRFPSVTNHEL